MNKVVIISHSTYLAAENFVSLFVGPSNVISQVILLPKSAGAVGKIASERPNFGVI